MNKAILFLLITLLITAYSCSSKKEIRPLSPYTLLDSGLIYGKYHVGFNFFEEKVEADTVTFGIWYPHNSSSSKMRLIDFEQMVNRDSNQSTVTNNFINQESFLGELNRKILTDNLEILTNTNYSPKYIDDKFPIVIYSSKAFGPIYENWQLFEFLASHGYAVLTISPNNADRMVQTNIRDVHYMTSFLKRKIDCLDWSRIITAGYEIGDIASIEYLISNPDVLGHLSLNGAVGSKFGWTFADSIPEVTLKEINKPVLHLGTSNYFLKDESFENLDSLTNANAYYIFLDKSAPAGVSSYYTLNWVQSVDSVHHNMKINKEANYKNYRLMLESSLVFCDFLIGKKEANEFIRFVENSHPRSYGKY